MARQKPDKKRIRYAPVAQLDRASGYGPEGREFESSPARQIKSTLRGAFNLDFLVGEDSNRAVLRSKIAVFRWTTAKPACVPARCAGRIFRRLYETALKTALGGFYFWQEKPEET